jgi:hypothetical protein
MKEIKQECARSYRSDSKRLCRRIGEVFSVLGNDDFASPNDRSCKHMPIVRPVRAIHPVPSCLKQDIPQEGPKECACV